MIHIKSAYRGSVCLATDFRRTTDVNYDDAKHSGNMCSCLALQLKYSGSLRRLLSLTFVVVFLIEFFVGFIGVFSSNRDS